MSIDSYGAKLTRRDVSELTIASEQLVVVAETIRGMGPKWGEAAVNLLIAVNAVVTRIQNKGATAFARYLEKHPEQETRLLLLPDDMPDSEVALLFPRPEGSKE
jgi:hypothetical protein